MAPMCRESYSDSQIASLRTGDLAAPLLLLLAVLHSSEAAGRTHGHGQGYLDVNGLIPESVERVDYRKGPYRADTGDFNDFQALQWSHGGVH